MKEGGYVGQGVFRRKDRVLRPVTATESGDQDEEEDSSDLPALARRLEAARSTLTLSEQSILDFTSGRYGSELQMSPEEIARRRGLSVERVKEIKARAEAKMRKALESPPPEERIADGPTDTDTEDSPSSA